jgi:hypothetical protein
MLKALWDEVEAMMDAWNWTPATALKFIAENRDLYDGPIGEAYDTFAAVLSDVMNIEGLTMH